MTSVREETGYVEVPRPFRKPASIAVYQGVRDLGDEGWEAEVLRADKKRVWIYEPSRDAAIARARNLCAALNGSR